MMDKFSLRSIRLPLACIFIFFFGNPSSCYRMPAPVQSPYDQSMNAPNAVDGQYGAPASQLSPYTAGIRRLPNGYGGFPYPLQQLQINHDKMVMQNIAPDQYGRGPDIPLIFLPPRPGTETHRLRGANQQLSAPPETNYVVAQPSVPLTQSQGLQPYEGPPQDSGLRPFPYKKRSLARVR